VNISITTAEGVRTDPMLATYAFRIGEEGQRPLVGALRLGNVDAAVLELILTAGSAALEFWEEVGALITNDAAAARVEELERYLADQGHTLDHPVYRVAPSVHAGLDGGPAS
jgi:hypothetical protein